jgi:hypothetical protein
MQAAAIHNSLCTTLWPLRGFADGAAVSAAAAAAAAAAAHLQARVRAGSEASELRTALDALGKEKAATSEQLAVLKTQLCFVLQVKASGTTWHNCVLINVVLPTVVLFMCMPVTLFSLATATFQGYNLCSALLPAALICTCTGVHLCIL